MADYSNSKEAVGAAYPENAIQTTFPDLEPLITVQQLKDRHLFGVSLYGAKDPSTGKAAPLNDSILSDLIAGAVSAAELQLKIDIFPKKRREKQPFDINLYNSFGYLQLNHMPCTSIDKLSVNPSNNIDVYVLPKEWIEGAFLVKGQVNIVPLSVAFVQGTTVSQSSGGAFFLNIMGNRGWVPAFWQCEYTSGFPNGMVPRIINDYIGSRAAFEVLSMLALAFARANSHSLGIDALSQSISTPGPQIFRGRLTELEEKMARIEKKVKMIFGFKLFSGTI
jgi:hypothetical protein